jgi:hypothetical protein
MLRTSVLCRTSQPLVMTSRRGLDVREEAHLPEVCERPDSTGACVLGPRPFIYTLNYNICNSNNHISYFYFSSTHTQHETFKFCKTNSAKWL